MINGTRALYKIEEATNMNPTVNAMHHMEGENPMMMFLMLMILCPGLFSGGFGQNPMMLIMLLMMMGGGKMF